MKQSNYCLFSLNCNPIACEGDDKNDLELIRINAISRHESFLKMSAKFPSRQFILWS